MQDLTWKSRWPECVSPKGQVKRSLPAPLKADIFKYRVLQVSPTLCLITTLKNMTTKIWVKCNKCNHRWKAQPAHLLRGHGCASCAGNIAIPWEERIKDIPPTIKVEGLFTHMKAPLHVSCTLCGYNWSTTADSLVYKQTGCPSCTNRLFDILYLLYCPIESIYKIGVTKNRKTLKPRMRSIHQDITLVDFWEIPDGKAMTLETLCHRTFKNFRVDSRLAKSGSTEFFQLNKLQIEQIYNIVQEYINVSI